MSTDISGQTAGGNAIFQTMPTKTPTLGEYLTRYMDDRGITPEEIQKRSEAAGEKIWNGYIYKLRNGEVDPRVSSLKKLARHLGCPEDELFAAARGITLAESSKYNNKFFKEIEDDYQALPDEDKRDLGAMIEMLRRDLWRRRKK